MDTTSWSCHALSHDATGNRLDASDSSSRGYGGKGGRVASQSHITSGLPDLPPGGLGAAQALTRQDTLLAARPSWPCLQQALENTLWGPTKVVENGAALQSPTPGPDVVRKVTGWWETLVLMETAMKFSQGQHAPLARAIHNLQDDETGRLIATCIHEELGGRRLHEDAVVAILDGPPEAPPIAQGVWEAAVRACTVLYGP